MMAPTINPSFNTSLSGSYCGPAPSYSFAPGSNAYGTSTSASGAGALVVFNQNNVLQGLWYHDDLHSPFATGRQINPFVPGLSPISLLPKPTYAAEDPLHNLFPAVRSPDDPLNEITDVLFADMRAACKAASSDKQKPIAARSMTTPRH